MKKFWWTVSEKDDQQTGSKSPKYNTRELERDPAWVTGYHSLKTQDLGRYSLGMLYLREVCVIGDPQIGVLDCRGEERSATTSPECCRGQQKDCSLAFATKGLHYDFCLEYRGVLGYPVNCVMSTCAPASSA